MRPVEVDEALDVVEAAIRKFESQQKTDEFVWLECGPAPQYIGAQGGPIGVVHWKAAMDQFEDCQKRIQPLFERIEKLPLVIDIEVEQTESFFDGELKGESWFIEFVKEHPAGREVAYG